jgi:hypothetical protein
MSWQRYWRRDKPPLSAAEGTRHFQSSVCLLPFTRKKKNTVVRHLDRKGKAGRFMTLEGLCRFAGGRFLSIWPEVFSLANYRPTSLIFAFESCQGNPVDSSRRMLSCLGFTPLKIK